MGAMKYNLHKQIEYIFIFTVCFLFHSGFCQILYAQHEQYAKYAVFITIDGLRREMITDPKMPSPVLKELVEKGLFVEKVAPVAPAITYPNHTALVTGARPVNHGIYYNAPFEGNVKSGVAYWYADSIKSPTIWHVAKENGLLTCSLFWPVSVYCKDIDYNIPEYWPMERGVDQWNFRKAHVNPPGLMKEIERYNSGQLTDFDFLPGKRSNEARTAFMSVYLLKRYRPNLTTIHLWSTDASQHAFGTASRETQKSLAAVDYAIGQIIEGMERIGILDSAVVVVSGDHGFTDVTRLLAPNVWLTAAALLSSNPEKWKARFHIAGSAAFLYLKDKNDKKTAETVRKLLADLPKDKQELFRIVEKKELHALGCSPDIELAIEPITGIGVSTESSGPDIIERSVGRHGYLQPRELTSAIFFGKGIPQGTTIERLNMTDIAPFIMELLGLEFVAPDGLPQQKIRALLAK
jgi:predicted AlkP superfamily pyrophosphatase or phosphodiesterase